MTAAPIPVTDAIPLMQVGGTLGQNNAKDFRRGLLASLFTATGLGTAREGVLGQLASGNQSQSGFEAFRVYPLSTPGLGVRVNGGVCIINRTGEGPYLVWMDTATSILDLPPAHATQYRLDTVIVRLADKNITADAGGSLHGGFIDYISGTLGSSFAYSGTPGAPGAPPIIPNGCLAIADIAREPGSSGDTIVSNEILLRRKATSLNGTPRFQFEEDGFSFGTVPGTSLGEIKASQSSSYAPDGPVMSLWDGAEWRGLRPYSRFARLTHGYVSANGTLGYIDPSDITSLKARHYALVSVATMVEFDGSFGSVQDDRVDVVIRVGNETSGNPYLIGNARNWSGGSGSRVVAVTGTIIIPEVQASGTSRLWVRLENKVGSGIYGYLSPSGIYETRVSVVLLPI